MPPAADHFCRQPILSTVTTREQHVKERSRALLASLASRSDLPITRSTNRSALGNLSGRSLGGVVTRKGDGGRIEIQCPCGRFLSEEHWVDDAMNEEYPPDWGGRPPRYVTFARVSESRWIYTVDGMVRHDCERDRPPGGAGVHEPRQPLPPSLYDADWLGSESGPA